MQLETQALVCTLLAHGENGLILRASTADHGLLAAYVPGGRSRKLRGVLQPGNLVALSLSARTEGQLPTGRLELAEARAALATSRAALATLEWATALTAAALPEAAPHPALHHALDALVLACAAEAPARTLGETLVRYELLLLADLGFGLDLTSCAATGSREDLAFVSPKSSQAVSRTAGTPWATRLLPLPAFLISPAPATVDSIQDGLRLTGHFLAQHILTGRHTALLPARARLLARLSPEQKMDEAPPAR